MLRQDNSIVETCERSNCIHVRLVGSQEREQQILGFLLLQVNHVHSQELNIMLGHHTRAQFLPHNLSQSVVQLLLWLHCEVLNKLSLFSQFICVFQPRLCSKFVHRVAPGGRALQLARKILGNLDGHPHLFLMNPLLLALLTVPLEQLLDVVLDQNTTVPESAAILLALLQLNLLLKLSVAVFNNIPLMDKECLELVALHVEQVAPCLEDSGLLFFDLPQLVLSEHLVEHVVAHLSGVPVDKVFCSALFTLSKLVILLDDKLLARLLIAN